MRLNETAAPGASARRERGQLKGKSHEGSGRQGRHRHRRRHPDRRGRGARAARLRRARRRAGRGRRGRRRVAATDPQGCRAWQVDITDDARLEQCVAEAARHFGRLDFLVNLAATYLDDGAASGRADWLRALDINLVSAVAAARAAPSGLRRRRHRQLHQHLGQGRADGPLALSGVQGRAGAAHTQHGDGLRRRPHPRQFGVARLDLRRGVAADWIEIQDARLRRPRSRPIRPCPQAKAIPAWRARQDGHAAGPGPAGQRL